jgi:hypothetical protein
MAELKQGKRYLVKTWGIYKSMSEVYVVEISPSGKRVNFKFNGGAEMWVNCEDYEIVEELD